MVPERISRIGSHGGADLCRRCKVLPMCLPATLGQAECAGLTALIEPVAYDSGTLVYRDRSAFDHLYLVHSGALKSWTSNVNGEMQILGFHFPGEMVGLDGIASGSHQCNLESLGHSELCRIPYARLGILARELPGLQRRIALMMGREFLLDHEHIAMMSARPAIERLALFIQTLARRTGQTVKHPQAIVLEMTRWELANFLALATETVSRLLAELQKRKIIRVDRRRLQIVDMQRLIEISGEDLGDLPCVSSSAAG